MYENSPEYFKKFQKRFKYNICETEPKLENTTIENYAYGYHSSATVIEGCTFGSNQYHVMYEFGSQDDNIFDSLFFLFFSSLSEAAAKSISTSTANKRSSTVPDVTIKRFCQLMLGEHSSTLYQIMDILLSGHGSFVRETSNSCITFQFCKN